MTFFAIRTRSLVAASAIAMVSSAAAAQEAPPQTTGTEEIIVSGTRASLENAERVKRDAMVVLDGISADDINALPDISLAEALVRVPGVTANDGPRGPDAVSIRGLGPDLSTTTVNGRVLATASGVDRRISLAQLPTEGIAGAYVLKTPEASTVEGGVAGTLNLLTIEPLTTRRKGLTLVVRGLSQDVSGALSDARHYGDLGARAEATYIGHITDNFGIALTYSYLKQYSAFAGQQMDNWRLGTGTNRADVNNDGNPDALPTNVSVISNFNDVTRHSGIGMLQWFPSDSVQISLDGMYTGDTQYSGPTRFLANNIYNGPLGPPVSTYVDETNTVQAFSGQVALYRGLYNEQREFDQTYGGGLKIVIDKAPFKATFDASFSEATRHQFGPQATVETDGSLLVNQRRQFTYDLRDPDNIQIGFVPTLPTEFALSQYNESLIRSRDTIKAFKADFEYDTGSPFLRSIAVGFKVDNRTHVKRQDNSLWSFNSLGQRPELDETYLQTQTHPFGALSSLFVGDNDINFPYFDIFKLSALKSAPNVVFDPRYTNDLAGTFDVIEDTAALYAQFNFESGGFAANAGLRYVITDVSVRGLTGSSPADFTPAAFDNSYSYLLPAVNIRYRLTPTLIARLGYSETFARQQFEDMRVSSFFDIANIPSSGVLNVNTGNPELRPFTSSGFDLSLEWYPDRSTSISVAGYIKRLKNFLTGRSETGTITLSDGSTVDVIYQSTFNDPTVRDLQGVEVGVRKQFDFLPGFLRNLGVQGNFNYNFTNVFQTTTSLVGQTVPASADLFSKIVVNGQLYYSTPKMDLRLAYRYFDPYIRAFFNSYQEQPAGQIDISGGVALFDNFRVIGSVTNLTKSRMRRYVPDYRDPNNTGITQMSVYQGRTVTLGIRTRF
jgi:TonB-dependent receptor